MSHADLSDVPGRGSAQVLSDHSREQARKSRENLRPFEAMLVKLEELDDYTHVALRQYPKAERHLLAADTRACIDKLLRLTIAAWKRHHKKTTLSELDIEIEVMRHRPARACPQSQDADPPC